LIEVCTLTSRRRRRRNQEEEEEEEGSPHNMQIKAAITENSVFVNISVTAHGIEIILVSIHMFLGVKNRTKPFL